MTPKGPSRWLTCQIIRIATRLAPRVRLEWAEAMTRETDAIPGQRDALRWAFGCLQASCHERLKSMRLTNLWPIRWGMALWMALLAIETLGSAGTTLAYKLG